MNNLRLEQNTNCYSQKVTASPYKNRADRWHNYIPTRNTNFGIFCLEILVYFMPIWNISQSMRLFYAHLVYFVVI
jgi:hypothetical protein